MRKILIVAHDFPPVQTSGVYRPLKFVKYLREFGWEPVVLTIDAVWAGQRDQRLLEDIPEGVHIKRTLQLDYHRLVNAVKRLAPGRQAGDAENRQGEPLRQSAERGAERTIRGKLSRLKSRVPVFVKDVFFVPDGAVPWVPVAALSVLRLAKEHRVDVMMTTSPPHSVHLAGLAASKITGIPWIADFRDLWLDTFDFHDKPFGKWRKPVEGWMEKAVVNHADRVINISHGESLSLQGRFPNLPAETFSVIHNGFDGSDFEARGRDSDRKDGTALAITHVGTLYPSTGDEYFHALECLFRDKPHLAERFEFRFVGHVAPNYLEAFEASSFRERVCLNGPLPHANAVQAMLDSDVLLLLQGGKKMGAGEIPGKVFEYMASERPILAVAWPGDVASILQESGLAYVVRPDDPAGLERTVMAMLHLKESGALRMKPDRAYIEGYERRRLTERLADVLDEMVGESGA